jgi:CDP-glucose 4,6-dehydratase
VWGYREGEPMGGFDPYSSSKGCAELVTAAYRSSFFTSGAHDGRPCAIASVRAGNVIGGGDWATDRLIPDIMAAFMQKRSALIRNPDAIRPWQHVLESIGGYLLLAERLWADGPGYSEAWNFGADESDCRPVSWIAQRLTELWGADALWLSPARAGAAPHEATWLKLDCSKAKARLGWRPRLDLAGALQWTVDWYRQAQAGADMREQTLSQTRRFAGLERS